MLCSGEVMWLNVRPPLSTAFCREEEAVLYSEKTVSLYFVNCS